MNTIKHIVLALLLAALLVAASGCSDPKEGKDCKQATWREASTVSKSDPGVGRHSIGAHEAGCYRAEIEGMNTRLIKLDSVCCDR